MSKYDAWFPFSAREVLKCAANKNKSSECVCVCVWSGICCVYLLGGVRQISWCVTGAIKVVALDTAHEQHNDSGLVLISTWLCLGLLAHLAAGLSSGLKTM